MNTIKSILSVALIAVCAASFTSCKKDDPTPTVSAKTISNLNADYAPAVGGTTGPPTYPTATGKFTLFSFATGAIVLNSDSATTKWDIGFHDTKIIINSGTSGPGTAKAQVISGIFDSYLTASESGFLIDNKNANPAFYAITRGPGNGWYNYNTTTNIVTPVAGRFLLVKTVDGKYAKMEIVSYYLDASPSPTTSTKDRYYTFRYVYQADGSTKLSN